MATFEVRGHKVRTASRRRFHIISVRETPIYVITYRDDNCGKPMHRKFQVAEFGYRCSTGDAAEAQVMFNAAKAIHGDAAKMEAYVSFAHVEGRSDSVATAKTRARRMRETMGGPGVHYIVIDGITGEEVV